MQQRGESGQLVKGRRTAKSKVRKTSNAVGPTDQSLEQFDHLKRERDEALQQRAAMSEVLSIIRRSPADAQPVFDAIVQSAATLCDAIFSVIYLREGNHLRVAATKNFSVEATSQIRNELEQLSHPTRSHAGGRAILNRAIVHIPDVLADSEYSRELALAGGWRAVLAVPLLQDAVTIGSISIGKADPAPFSDLQIQLLNTFADQAVIAIENVRLFEAEQQRTCELSESLQQQTATADVLKVISRSTFDLNAVLSTLVESATRLCSADHSWMFERKGDVFGWVAGYGHDTETNARIRDYFEKHPVGVDSGSVTGRSVLQGKVVHVTDVLVDPQYTWGGAQKIGGYRAGLSVPLWRQDEVVGVIFVARTAPVPFTARQIELVTTFGDQAVIAIENARLLNELRESLQQQTATADVLKVISRSTFDLQPVFDSMAESAVRLCEAERAYIFRFDGQVLRAVASFNAGPESKDWVYRNPIPLGRSSVSARAGLERRTVQVADIQADPEYSYVARDVDPIRTTLAVPMLMGEELIGTITIYRLEVKPFAENQIALMETFADQAVIAIENARLFENLQTRTRELAKSLEDLRTTQDRLVQTQKLASLGQLTAGIAHEIKNPLNFVNNFSGISSELIDELQDTLKGPLDSKARAEIAELADTLRGNLDKIVQHGKRADAIVKNMLLHSREGSGEHRPVDINALVEESLNLAYHGARAEKQGFNITLERAFDPAAGQADVFPQDITRVLLNLISNGFYAAIKRKAETGDGYEPTLLASTRSLGDRVEIRVWDNGTGIPPEVREKIFNPFFTTKPAGEGTGLGLSISHDVIVKQHGGSIEVETEPGAFSEFIIVLPRGGASLTKPGEPS